MIINFGKPWFFLLLPVVFLFLFFIGRKRKSRPFQKNLSLGVRFFVCILLIAALAVPSVMHSAKKTTTIFAVDLSASVEGAEEKTKLFLAEAEKTITSDDEAGIVCFGEKAIVEQKPGQIFSLSEFHSFVNDEFTSISEGLELSSTLIPEGSRKRIVLISDGNENKGDAINQAKLLQSQQTAVDIYAIGDDIGKEVQLTSIKTPPYSNKNVDYEIEITIDSLIDTKTKIKVYKGNQLMIHETVSVWAGQNKYVFTDHALEGGGILYRGEIEPEKDTMKENNTAFTYCYIEDVPSVLIVEQEGSASEIKKILEGSQLHVVSVSASSAPVAMEQLNVYDTIVLADVSMEYLPKGFAEALESYVRHTGGGVIVTGGENSYALGDYYDTPLENLLPVDMELKTDSQTPNLGMIMVIDHSGSMSDSRYGLPVMEMAKEAAIRGVESLHATDSIGIIQFDDIAEWAVEFQKVGENLSGIQEKIGEIQPAGGTSILPALRMAFDQLRIADTRLKHIILLTDGQAEQSGYDNILKGMNEMGITLSTVAVGNGADTKLLEKLAENGKGRFYFTNEFTNLPEIFAKEALLAGKEYLNHHTFYPVLQDSSPVLNGITSIASLDGYIGTTAKPRADVLLKSDTEDPILATWQYGLGRSAAWTSDLNGQWSRNWLGSEDGIRLFRNLVSWTMRSQASRDILIQGERTEQGGKLTVDMGYQEDIKKLSAVVLSSDNQEYHLDLTSTAPGIYSGQLPDAKEGAYIVNILVEKEDGSVEHINSGFSFSYSSEYDIREFQNGKSLLRKIAEITGGRILTNPEDVFSQEAAKINAQKEISAWFLVFALLIFLFDIALRRFYFIGQKIESVSVQWNEKWKMRKKMEPVLVKKEEQKKEQATEMEQKVETQPKETSKKNTASILASQKKKRNR